jgi:hypothetical protein
MLGAFILTNTESEMEINAMNKMLRENLSKRNAEEIIAMFQTQAEKIIWQGNEIKRMRLKIRKEDTRKDDRFYHGQG